MTDTFDIVSVKAFGDLIIILSSLKSAPTAHRTRLLLGRHLQPLFDALGCPVEARWLTHGEAGVPSFYDIRKNGMRKAAVSALRLRREVASAASPNVLLFDRLGWRERFLAGGMRARALPRSDNIYLAYRALFGNPVLDPALPGGSGHIGIFPGSRLARKNLPLELVDQVKKRIAAHGAQSELLLLDGERPDLEHAGLGGRVLPRSFGAMIDAVSACDAVISADSMPAHLAEMMGRPVFVFTPAANNYWLPYSALASNRWALFRDGSGQALAGFLSGWNADDGR